MAALPSALTLALTAPDSVDNALIRGAKKDLALFKAITSADIETFLKTLNRNMDMTSEANNKLIEETIDLFAFDGFDPEVVYKHFIIVKTELKCKMVELKADLVTLLTIGHLKGNINQNNIKGLSKEAKHVFKNLVSRWALALKVEDKKLDVTIPRIVLAFPREVTMIAKKHKKEYAGPFHSSQLPWYMKTSVFPSLVPAGINSHMHFLVAGTLYACDQSMALRKDKLVVMTSDQRMDLFSRQLAFTMTAFNSSVVPEEQRIAFCKDVLKIHEDIAKIPKILAKIKLGTDLEKLTEDAVEADIKKIQAGSKAKKEEDEEGE